MQTVTEALGSPELSATGVALHPRQGISSSAANLISYCNSRQTVLEYWRKGRGTHSAACRITKEVSDLATTLPSQAAPVHCYMCGGRGWQVSVESRQLDFLRIRTLSQAAKHQWTVMPTSPSAASLSQQPSPREITRLPGRSCVFKMAASDLS